MSEKFQYKLPPNWSPNANGSGHFRQLNWAAVPYTLGSDSELSGHLD